MFQAVAAETLAYLLRDLLDPGGAFYAAEDAGDVGKEGEFYVWAESEIENYLNEEELRKVKEVYGVSTLGNFENNFNILNLQSQQPWSAKKDPILISAQKKLFQARAERRRPHLDDKILCAWNGLMISALCAGYNELDDKQYLQAAINCATFIRDKMFIDDLLHRSYCKGEASHLAVLEDYAYLIQGLLDLYESSNSTEWKTWAIKLQAQEDSLFWDSSEHGYFYAQENAPGVILRKKDYTDGAIPSANGVTALNLLRLHSQTSEQKYLDRAKELLVALSGLIEQFPAAAVSTLLAVDYMIE